MKKNSETKQKKKFELPHIFVLPLPLFLYALSLPGFSRPENLNAQ